MENITKLVVVVVLFLGGGATSAPEPSHDPDSYKGFQVLDVSIGMPSKSSALRDLVLLRHRDLGVVDVWGLSGSAQAEETRAAIMVAPGRVDGVREALQAANLTHSVLWDDVQRILDIEEKGRANRPQLRDHSGRVSFDRFMRYHEIENYLQRLSVEHGDVLTLERLGPSVEGREIQGACVSRGGCGERPAILVDAGIHAREWLAPAAALYLLHQLVENHENSQLIDDYDWYILPVLNPDGYEYSHTKNRFWRKNRSNESDPWCKGVDINRNFDMLWAEFDSSHHPCDINFVGPRPFSEPESRAFRDFVTRKNTNHNIKMYLTLHSWGWHILYPYGTPTIVPEDAEELQAIAEKANAAMVAAGSAPYRIGQSGILLYPATGASDDWSKGKAGIQKVFTIDLPGGGGNGFDIEESKILNTVKQVFEGIKEFAKYAKTP